MTDVSTPEHDAALAEVERPRTPDTAFGRWLVETALVVLLAFLLALGIRTFVVQAFVIPSTSMVPAIEVGDRVLADKLTFRFIRTPQPGDVVVLDDPNQEHPQLIKRVIATGGQEVDIQDGAVVIDGARLDEPYTFGKRTDAGPVPMPTTVPEGHVWLMGDNRPYSGDSRFFDSRPVTSVRGRAFLTYWPPSRFGALK